MKSASPRALTVGVISQWFSPEPVPIPGSITQGLADRGYDVRVLTSFPSYPTGLLYDGYDDRRFTEEATAGARLMRVPSFLSHDLSAIRRLRSFLSFGAQSLRKAVFLRNVDVNYVYATPMTASIAAVACRLLWNTPYVLHIQDLWPESITDSGMMPGGWKKSLVSALTKVALRPIYSKASEIVVISPSMKEALIQRGVDESKISIIYNWHADENSVNAVSLKGSPTRDSPTLHCVYAGNIGQMQDVETIVRAAAAVEKELDLRVSIYGSGVAAEKIEALAESLGVKNVRLLGRVSAEEMQAIYKQSDFQFVTLRDLPLFRMTIPSKFQASLANGVPIITTVQGDLADLCTKNGLGFVAQPENVSDLASAIRKAAAMQPAERLAMSERARSYYSSHLTAEVAIDRLCLVLAKALKET